MPRLCIVTIGDSSASRVRHGSMADLFLARAAARGATAIFTVGTAANAPARLAQLQRPREGFDQVDFIGHGIHASSGESFFAFAAMQQLVAGRGLAPSFVRALCYNVGSTEAPDVAIVNALARVLAPAVQIYFEACELGADQTKLQSLGSQLRSHGATSSIAAYTSPIVWTQRAPHPPVVAPGFRGEIITITTS